MEIISSFIKNIKDKLANPYFGTLILVLIFHHWELVFTVLNFDDEITLDTKLTYIKTYITNNITIFNLLWNTLLALVFMLIAYLIIILTRSIVLWIEFWLMPIIIGKIINKNVVRKSDYDEVVKEREEYFDQYENQRKNVRTFSKTIDIQTEQIKQKDKQLIDQTETISKNLKKLDGLEEKLENMRNYISKKTKELKRSEDSLSDERKMRAHNIDEIKKFKQLFFDEENQNFYSSKEKFPPTVINKLNELKKDNKLSDFIKVGSFFETGGIMNGPIISEMIERELVFHRDTYEKLTPLGKLIYFYRKKLVFNE